VEQVSFFYRQRSYFAAVEKVNEINEYRVSGRDRPATRCSPGSGLSSGRMVANRTGSTRLALAILLTVINRKSFAGVTFVGMKPAQLRIRRGRHIVISCRRVSFHAKNC
jgi:hypothetical protein